MKCILYTLGSLLFQVCLLCATPCALPLVYLWCRMPLTPTQCLLFCYNFCTLVHILSCIISVPLRFCPFWCTSPYAFLYGLLINSLTFPTSSLWFPVEAKLNLGNELSWQSTSPVSQRSCVRIQFERELIFFSFNFTSTFNSFLYVVKIK